MESTNGVQQEDDLLPSRFKSILVLDDEFDIVTVIKRSLARQGFAVSAFTHPLLAMEHFQLKSKNYELVLCDIRMPNMTGFQFARRVREINPSTKILLMSAFNINDLRFSKVLAYTKIDGFIQKPISPNLLVSTIEKCFVGLNAKHQQQQLTECRRTSECYDLRLKRLLWYLFGGIKGGVNRAKILDIVNARPSNANQIASELKLSYKTVTHHLSVLSKNGLIMADKEGSYGAAYFLTPEMEKHHDLLVEILSKFGKSENSTSQSDTKKSLQLI